MGDVGQPELVRTRRAEVPADEIGRRRSGRAARGHDPSPLPAPRHALQRKLAHQPRDSLLAHPDALGAKLGVKPRSAVGLERLGEGSLEERLELEVSLPTRRRRAAPPGVVARPGDPEHAAEPGDAMLCLLRLDQPDSSWPPIGLPREESRGALNRSAQR